MNDKLSVRFHGVTFSRTGPPTWIGNPALGGQLSEQHPERPDVRLDGEAAVQRRLRGGPLDGELGSCKVGGGDTTETMHQIMSKQRYRESYSTEEGRICASE